MKQMKEFKNKSELYAEYVRLKSKYEPHKKDPENIKGTFINKIRCYGDDGEGTRCNICDRRIWGRKIWYDIETCDICKKILP